MKIYLPFIIIVVSIVEILAQDHSINIGGHYSNSNFNTLTSTHVETQGISIGYTGYWGLSSLASDIRLGVIRSDVSSNNRFDNPESETGIYISLGNWYYIRQELSGFALHYAIEYKGTKSVKLIGVNAGAAYTLTLGKNKSISFTPSMAVGYVYGIFGDLYDGEADVAFSYQPSLLAGWTF